jgi:HAD superfamily hydrolase (TIGR01549 family)
MCSRSYELEETAIKSSKARTISFDLDGTLTTRTFADAVWDKGLPSKVSKSLNISERSAALLCRHAYETIGDRSVNYYSLPFWLKYLSIKADAQEIINEFSGCIKLFDDVIPVLTMLKNKGFRLVIFSNATRLFLDAEMKMTTLDEYFDKVISLPDDWGTLKSDKMAFKRLNDTTGEFVHVGDNIHHDFEAPKKAGYDAFHIYRGDGQRHDDSLNSLVEFAEIICK